MSVDDGLQPVNKNSSRTRRKIVGLASAGVLVITVMSGWLALKVYEVQAELKSSLSTVATIRAQLSSGDHDGALFAATELVSQTNEARVSANDPVWQLASLFPIIGPNLIAIREVAVSADDLASLAALPLIQEYGSFDSKELTSPDGRIDIESIASMSPTLNIAAETVIVSHKRLTDIDTSELVGPVSDPLNQVVSQLDEAEKVVSALSSAAMLLPPMLGIEEPRNYLVLIQNSAEVRATGGIPGALAVIRAENGQLKLTAQDTAAALGNFSPAVDVEQEQLDLYTARLGTQMQNVNLTPDFVTAASTAMKMWEIRHGLRVDGVLGVDLIVLSNLLSATGPVDLKSPSALEATATTDLPKTLSAQNIVPTLLSEVYSAIEDPGNQDAYYASVANEVFGALQSGKGATSELIAGFRKSADEGRLLVWSSHSKEQEQIENTPLSGRVSDTAGASSFGVYFNDGTGAKMDYYVTRTVQLIETCNQEDSGFYTVRILISNTAPLDAAEALPKYVTGGGIFGVHPGNVRTNYVVYGPVQSFLETASINGDTVPLGAGKHGSRPVGTITVEVGPGETAQVDMNFSRVVQDGVPTLQVTPTLVPAEEVVLPAGTTICD